MHRAHVAFFLLLLPAVVLAQVEITALVNDYASILGNETPHLSATLTQLRNDGIAEFAIVTIPTLDGRDIEGYAFELAEDVLGNKEKNNGLLLLIAVEDRQYRFEVGRGLEPVLPDILVSRIGREYLVPHFKNKEYGKGVAEAVNAVALILHGEQLPEQKNTLNKTALAFIALLFFGIVIFLIIYSVRQARNGKKYTNDNDFFLAAAALGTLLRNNGGKGGFGGFGGGSFGGGGASGGW